MANDENVTRNDEGERDKAGSHYLRKNVESAEQEVAEAPQQVVLSSLPKP